MKKLLLMPFVVLLFILDTAPNTDKNLYSHRAKKHPVLVQLFTSQGCSSCPPADKLLGDLTTKYNGSEVYFLAYHVDYWDRLGWKDPYSKKQFTQKQYDYAGQFNLNSVYTPQAVVNGTYQFTGSNSANMQKAITSSTNATRSDRELSLSLFAKAENTLTLKYKTNTLASGENLFFAFYLKKQITAVAKGENRGRKLLNYNTVLDEKNTTNPTGTLTFDMPEAQPLTNLGVMGYIQGKDKSIIAVTAIDLKN